MNSNELEWMLMDANVLGLWMALGGVTAGKRGLIDSAVWLTSLMGIKHIGIFLKHRSK
jgi:hypothetical protein